MVTVAIAEVVVVIVAVVLFYILLLPSNLIAHFHPLLQKNLPWGHSIMQGGHWHI